MTGVVDINISRHPAVVAWNRFRLGRRPPTGVEVLKETRNTSDHLIHGVYRLHIDPSTGDSVVAKRTDIVKGKKERMVYDEILGQVAVRSLRCYGIQEEDESEHAWLFIEDAGSGSFQPKNETHQILKGKWLGNFHVEASQLAASMDLIHRGPDNRRDCLASIIRNIEGYFDDSDRNPVFEQRFREVLSAGNQILSVWAEIEDTCKEMPWTVVHGDLVPKNMSVRSIDVTVELLAFDWQTACWAPPGADLAPGYWNNSGAKFLSSYLSTVTEAWPRVTISTVRRLARVGSLFRMIDAIEWDLSWIDEWQPETLDARMRTYRKRLQKFVASR